MRLEGEENRINPFVATCEKEPGDPRFFFCAKGWKKFNFPEKVLHFSSEAFVIQ